MKYNLEYLFDNIENGTVIGYYRSVFLPIIRLVQRLDSELKNLDKITHLGIVFDLERTDKRVLFKHYDCTFSKGVTYTIVAITKNFDSTKKSYTYSVNLNSMYSRAYSFIPAQSFDIPTCQKAVNYINKMPKKYGKIEFLLSVPFISKFIGKRKSLDWVLRRKKTCTTMVRDTKHIMSVISGQQAIKDPFPTPERMVNLLMEADYEFKCIY